MDKESSLTYYLTEKRCLFFPKLLLTNVKYKQDCQGFELGSTFSFPISITITLWIHSCICAHTYLCMCLHDDSAYVCLSLSLNLQTYMGTYTCVSQSLHMYVHVYMTVIGCDIFWPIQLRQVNKTLRKTSLIEFGIITKQFRCFLLFFLLFPISFFYFFFFFFRSSK